MTTQTSTETDRSVARVRLWLVTVSLLGEGAILAYLSVAFALGGARNPELTAGNESIALGPPFLPWLALPLALLSIAASIANDRRRPIWLALAGTSALVAFALAVAVSTGQSSYLLWQTFLLVLVLSARRSFAG